MIVASATVIVITVIIAVHGHGRWPTIAPEWLAENHRELQEEIKSHEFLFIVGYEHSGLRFTGHYLLIFVQ